MKSNTYYQGDLKLQEQILTQQIYHMPQQMQWDAMKRLNKRVLRFYGLNNKYHANGSLRK